MAPKTELLRVKGEMRLADGTKLMTVVSKKRQISSMKKAGTIAKRMETVAAATNVPVADTARAAIPDRRKQAHRYAGSRQSIWSGVKPPKGTQMEAQRRKQTTVAAAV